MQAQANLPSIGPGLGPTQLQNGRKYERRNTDRLFRGLITQCQTGVGQPGPDQRTGVGVTYHREGGASAQQ
jgi:hypothetical protein